MRSQVYGCSCMRVLLGVSTSLRQFSLSVACRSYKRKFCTSNHIIKKQRYSSIMSVNKEYIISNDVPICQLTCTTAFQGLDQKEKKYAHYLSKACNEGGLIVLLQTSPESPGLFLLLQNIFSEESADELRENLRQSVPDISDDDFQSLLTFASGFYSNMGNYKSFGDTKILPALSKEKFSSIIKCSKAYQKNTEQIEKLWNEISGQVYQLDKRTKELGIGEKGLSTYYSSNITTDDISFVQEFMKQQDLSSYNTRIFKILKDGGISYNLRLASAASEDKDSDEDATFSKLGKHTFKDKTINVTRGDYAALMKRVNDNLLKAKEFASNENEKRMIENYIKSFQYGSIDAHKDGSRFWIKNKGPVVETYIGFIESYRDPYGVRGEFEGFVSMVNKEMSAKFSTLVEKAEDFLKILPWPSEYEKDKFLRPDFTSLDVLNFAGSGIPAGINIPNYDDIRQNEGFKNVSLGNVLQAHTTDQKVTFLSSDDQALYSKLKASSFEVQVGLHELLGHGSGKLLREEEGSFNFDTSSVKDLESNGKIATWYKENDTYDTVFGSMGSSYEECRAECVGLHLCLNDDVLRIFGFDGDQAKDIFYINWLNMVRAGLLGLEFYSPETKAWKQAHMNARYVILQVLLEAGDEFVKITETTGEDGQPDLLLTLDRSKIETTGRKAIAHFLMRLQLYKSTADLNRAQNMYQGYSKVGEDMLKKRSIVLARKQPRRMFAQANTIVDSDGNVSLREYNGDKSSLIQSFIDRYKSHDEELQELWLAEKDFHRY